MSGPRVVAAFASRDVAEPALEQLQALGIDRAAISLVEASRPAAGLVAAPEQATATDARPIDRAETGNLQGLVAGIPAYLGAVLAAGVTVASGGALAGVAIAALAGGAAGGAVGGVAARLLGEGIDARYDEQLRRGGIVVMIACPDAATAARAVAALREAGALDAAPGP
jgi:hypothetical protein